jgi:acyl-CoA thioester hydrolase
MSSDAARDGWYRVRMPVRFRDLDPMGHAHHTLPLVYVEEARASLWRALTGSAGADSPDYIMAEVTVRYHARIAYPCDLSVGLMVRRVGTSSFLTDFDVRDPAGVLLASGRAAHVSYDYAAGRSKPLDPALREALQARCVAAA